MNGHNIEFDFKIRILSFAIRTLSRTLITYIDIYICIHIHERVVIPPSTPNSCDELRPYSCHRNKTLYGVSCLG